MKIYFVNTNKAWGGGEKWHLETASMLKKRGHQVALLCTEGYELYIRATATEIPVIKVNIGNLSFLNPFVIHSLKHIFRTTTPDVVIINLSSDLKAAGIAAKLAGIKNIIYRRGNAKPVKNSIMNRLLFGRILTGIIANSEETKRAILKHKPDLFPSVKIKVLYNGIDLNKYDSLDPTPVYEESENRIVLGSAGRLSNEKGHHLLMEMALLLKKKGISFRMLIAGEGPAKDMLLEKRRNYGLDLDVILVGFVNDIKSFMKSVDIFILPSLWEGFGYVSIEAMACSKPVVAFNTGSNPEILVDGETGFLIKCFETNELTEKVAQLAGNEALRNEFGRKGRKRVELLFNSEKTEKGIIEYIESL